MNHDYLNLAPASLKLILQPVKSSTALESSDIYKLLTEYCQTLYSTLQPVYGSMDPSAGALDMTVPPSYVKVSPRSFPFLSSLLTTSQSKPYKLELNEGLTFSSALSSGSGKVGRRLERSDSNTTSIRMYLTTLPAFASLLHRSRCHIPRPPRCLRTWSTAA